MQCRRGINGATQCSMKNIVLDFTRAKVGPQSKLEYLPGFLQMERCALVGDWGELAMREYPIYSLLDMDSNVFRPYLSIPRYNYAEFRFKIILESDGEHL